MEEPYGTDNQTETLGKFNFDERTSIPTTSNLELGEVAINTYHGKMYIKKNDGSESIVEVGAADNTKLPLAGGTMTGALNMGGNSITDSGDLTLDAAGDIILDADGGDVLLKDGGFLGKSAMILLKSQISDGDFAIKGNDGGSTITHALLFDMSQAGRATFNEGIVLKSSTAGDYVLATR